MTLVKKNEFNSVLILNLVFSFFPISFIIGNAVTNINIVLFCLLGIFYLKSKILEIKFDLPLKIIFLFFCVVLLSTSISFIKSLYLDGFEYENLNRLIKSITFFRFFLMLLIVYQLCQLDVLNFKYFFLSAAFSPIIVSIDIIYQYFFGLNILGLEAPDAVHRTGFFGDEIIAGGYIKNFSFFSILFLFFILKNKNYTKFLLTTIIICILGLAILFSGNRMPLVFFLLGLILAFFFKHELRKITLLSIIALLILFKFIFSYDKRLESSYSSFYGNTIGLAIYITKNLVKENKKLSKTETSNTETASETKKQEEVFHFVSDNSQLRLVVTALDIWSRNKIIGNGIKSFRADCIKFFAGKSGYTVRDYSGPSHEEIEQTLHYLNHFLQKYVLLHYQNVQLLKKRLCSNHPHNYYLQILTETGIIGFLVISIIAFLFLIFIFRNFKLLKGNSIKHFLILSCVISLFLEMTPFRSTGSIFSTNNVTYIILISSIILNYKKILMDKKK